LINLVSHYQKIIKKNKHMTKQQKIMLGILGVGAIAYYLWYKNKNKKSIVEVTKDTEIVVSPKSTPTLSESDKVALFEKLLTPYQDGAASDEMLKIFGQTRIEAKKKIQDLGLSSEYENYAKRKVSERKEDYSPYPKVGKYVVTMQTNLLRRNPNKKDMFGDVGTDVVRTLNVGEVIDVVRTGGGGRGIVMTPYYFLADGSFVSYGVKKV